MSERRVRSLYTVLTRDPRDAGVPPGRPAIIGPGGTAAWKDLAEWTGQALGRLSTLARQRVGLITRPAASSVVCLAALDRLSADVFLISPELDEGGRRQLVRDFRLTACVDGAIGAEGLSAEIQLIDGGDPGDGEGMVTILTSGTSGSPKAARHSWEILFRPVRQGLCGDAPRWLLTYPLRLYAGLQVLCQCLVDHGTLVIAPPGASSDEVARLLVEHRVEFASGTPSFWRRLALLADRTLLADCSLRQITLGGETVEQGVLDLLKQRMPRARLIHIYATTEHGRCFSVTDERAGFPKRFLDGPSPDGVQMRIEGGQLVVLSTNAMRGYDRYGQAEQHQGAWRPTGDLVRIEGDRVYFAGRLSDIINVGGSKVHPLEVERYVRSVAGVADVRVYPRRSSVVGQLVACEIVVEEGFDPEVVRAAVSRSCAERLPSEQRPRFIEIVPQLALSEAGKAVRRASS
jgi:acyl-CoA synthetase (AMP-forming)/AMP-acid ligase II